MTINSTTRKTSSLVGNGNTHTYPFAFKVFTDADVVVKKLEAATSVETTLTLGASNDYIVTLSADQDSNPGGSITLRSGGSDQNLASGFSIVITSAVTPLQGTDLTNQGGFYPEVINDALDKAIILHQQQQDEIDRTIKFSLTNTIGSLEITENAAARKNKVISFDNAGELSVLKELGTYRGNWAASTAYVVRDLVKDTSTSNIFYCNTAHTSSGAQPLTTNTHSANWDLIVDAATATTSATNAASSATAAATSATAAATSATAAASSATAAASSASTASTKATEATTAKTAAETAKTAAETAKTAAETALDSFDDRYLGVKSSNPTLDNDGAALLDGALYFNGTSNIMRVYDLGNTAWLDCNITGSNLTNTNTVAAAITNVNNVGGSIANVNTVATNISSVNAVAGDIAKVVVVANDLNETVSEIETAAADLQETTSEIDTVANAITNVDNVGNNIANVNTVAGISANVTTVAGNNANVTTVAGAITNVNNVGGSIANVNTCATNLSGINSFAARYRTDNTGNNPSSNNDAGDLFFNQGSGKLLVYNGSTSAWEETQSIGSFFINTISSFSGTGGNSATFNGAAYKFTLSNAGQFAQQMLVSINGVVQKPNTGTGQPAEGFALDGANIVFSSPPASNAPFFIITIGSTVSIGTPSANTVTTAILQNGSVTAAKIGNLDANVDFADGARARFGASSDVQIYHDSGSNYVKLGVAGSTLKIEGTAETLATFTDDGACELNYNNAKIFETANGGARLSGWLSLGDNNKVYFGTDDDLQIYHDGSHGYLTNTTGVMHFMAKSGENGIKINPDGNVELYYDNAKKLETVTGGATITGVCTATSFAGDGSALTGIAGGVTSDAQENTVAGTNAGDSFTGTDATDNALFGYNTGTAITTGDKNTASGSEALKSCTTGSENHAFGYKALENVQDGNYNIAIGGEAANDNVSGGGNIAIGHKAWDQAVGSNNVAIGYEAASAVNTGMNGMTAIGYRAAYAITNDGGHLAIGHEALMSCTTGIRNTGVGFKALRLTTGSQNTGFGFLAGVSIGAGSRNTMLGHETGQATNIGNDNTLAGYNAAYLNTEGNENVAVGNTAMYNNATGDENTAIGGRAMYGSSASSESFKNTCIGYESGEDLSTGSYNTYIGAQAAHEATTGNNNIALGINAGGTLTTGSGNILIGHEAGYNQVSTDANNLWIARGATGHGATAVFISADNSGNLYRTGGGSAFNTTSDERTKKNITDNNEGLSLIKQLRVRNFEWRTEDEIDRTAFGGSVDDPKYTKEEAAKLDSVSEGEYKKRYGLDKPGTHVGLIAQELETVKAKWVNTTEEGKKTIDPSELIWTLVNAVKELSEKNTALEARIATLEAA